MRIHARPGSRACRGCRAARCALPFGLHAAHAPRTRPRPALARAVSGSTPAAELGGFGGGSGPGGPAGGRGEGGAGDAGQPRRLQLALAALLVRQGVLWHRAEQRSALPKRQRRPAARTGRNTDSPVGLPQWGAHVLTLKRGSCPIADLLPCACHCYTSLSISSLTSALKSALKSASPCRAGRRHTVAGMGGAHSRALGAGHLGAVCVHDRPGDGPALMVRRSRKPAERVHPILALPGTPPAHRTVLLVVN